MHYDLIWKQSPCTAGSVSCYLSTLLALQCIHYTVVWQMTTKMCMCTSICTTQLQCSQTDESEEGAAMCMSVASVLKQSGPAPQDDGFIWRWRKVSFALGICEIQKILKSTVCHIMCNWQVSTVRCASKLCCGIVRNSLQCKWQKKYTSSDTSP